MGMPALRATVSCAFSNGFLRSVHHNPALRALFYSVGLSARCQWNIAEKPVVYRREADGLSPICRCSLVRVAVVRPCGYLISNADAYIQTSVIADIVGSGIYISVA